jgi:hypothetical protein
MQTACMSSGHCAVPGFCSGVPCWAKTRPERVVPCGNLLVPAVQVGQAVEVALVQIGQAGERRLWLCVPGMLIGTAIAYLDFQMRDRVL